MDKASTLMQKAALNLMIKGMDKKAGIDPVNWYNDTMQMNHEAQAERYKAAKKGVLRQWFREAAEPFSYLGDAVSGEVPWTTFTPEGREQYREWIKRRYNPETLPKSKRYKEAALKVLEKTALSSDKLIQYMARRAEQGVGGDVMGVPGVLNRMNRSASKAEAVKQVPTLNYWARRGGNLRDKNIRAQAEAVAAESKVSPRVQSRREWRQQDIADAKAGKGRTIRLVGRGVDEFDPREVTRPAVQNLMTKKPAISEIPPSPAADSGLNKAWNAVKNEAKLWSHLSDLNFVR